MEEHRHTAPTHPYFDPIRRAWVLSRYVDVYAALREPALCQAAENHQIASPEENARSHAALYEAVQADIARMSSQQWRAQVDGIMRSFLNRAATGEAVDLVRAVIQPWSVAVLVHLSGAGPIHLARIPKLAKRLFYRQSPAAHTLYARMRRKWFSRRYKKAEAELDRLIQSQQFPLSKSMFAGLIQTLPSFLAKAWLGLLQNPHQSALLRDKPELMANAVEELLRYAGIVHTISRYAASDVLIGETRIAKGDHVILNFAAANYDPAKFDQPTHLNISRLAVGHLGLGTGLHTCVGAILVRNAVAVVTPAFLASHPVLEPGIIWTSDTALSWPLVVPARLTKTVPETAH